MIKQTLQSFLDTVDHIDCSGSEHIRFDCPTCSKNGNNISATTKKKKYKLYVHKEKKVGFCFVCHTVFVDTGNKSYSVLDVVNKVEKVQDVDSDFLYNVFMENSIEHDEKGIKYLLERSPYLTNDLIKKYGFRYGHNKIYIPFYNQKGKFITYQVRKYGAFTGGKYDNPKSGKQIYFLNSPNPPKINGQVVVVEGVFDALATTTILKKSSLALLGSYPSPLFFDFVYSNMDKEFIIFMDKLKLSNQIHDRIKKKIPHIKVKVYNADANGDVENYLYENINNL